MELNPEQKAAAEYEGDKSILLLAGAGTGKTKTIIERVIYLINSGVSPKRILLLTFTRKAAHEMVERLTEALGSKAEDIFAGTFHSFCLLAIRNNPTLFGLGNRTIIDADDQAALMKTAVNDIADVAGYSDILKPKELVSMFSFARNVEMDHAEYLEHYHYMDEEEIGVVMDVFRRYDQLKRKGRYLDFDDILNLFLNVLRSKDEAKEKFSALCDHILVDEMQDTNPVQWSILKELRDPAKLFCVGDDAQSIYAFRGADFESIHSFTKHIPDSIVMKLTINYRCTQEILDVSNELLDRSTLEYDKHLSAFKGDGHADIVFEEFNDNFVEARFIANAIRNSHHRGKKWSDHLVLVRSAWVNKPLQALLTQHDIPYEVVGGQNIFQSAHVKDVTSALRLYVNIHDELAWTRFLTMYPKIGVKAVEKHFKVINDLDTFEEAVGYCDRAIKNDDITKVLNRMMDSDKPADIISKCVRHLEPVLKKKHDHWSSRESDFELMVDLAREHVSVADFLDEYSLDPAATPKKQLDKVTISTIHAAKGTERKVCFVMATQKGVFPNPRCVSDIKDIEEERRIMYVALTRAQEEMYITRGEIPGYVRRNPDVMENDLLDFLFDEDHKMW